MIRIRAERIKKIAKFFAKICNAGQNLTKKCTIKLFCFNYFCVHTTESSMVDTDKIMADAEMIKILQNFLQNLQCWTENNAQKTKCAIKPLCSLFTMCTHHWSSKTYLLHLQQMNESKIMSYLLNKNWDAMNDRIQSSESTQTIYCNDFVIIWTDWVHMHTS